MMRRAIALGITLAGFAAVAGCPLRAAAAPKVAWGRSYSAALKQAQKTGRIVLADFYTDWCGYCKKLDAETFTDPQVVKLAGQFVLVKLNAEKEGAAAARKYGVTGYPTLLFLTADGTMVHRIGGFLPAKEFAGQLTEVSQAKRDLPALADRLRKNPDDAEAASKLIFLYARWQRAKEARALLTQIEAGHPRLSGDKLGQAYLAVASLARMQHRWKEAVPLFEKAIGAADNPEMDAYGYLSIAACYMEQGKKKEMVAPLEALVRLPRAPDGPKKQAEQMLAMLKQGK